MNNMQNKSFSDILDYSIGKKCWILARKPSHKVEVPFKNILSFKGLNHCRARK